MRAAKDHEQQVTVQSPRCSFRGSFYLHRKFPDFAEPCFLYLKLGLSKVWSGTVVKTHYRLPRAFSCLIIDRGQYKDLCFADLKVTLKVSYKVGRVRG